MLAKSNRLKKKKDFERVFKTGKGFRESFLFFKIAKNNLDVSRFGFVVGKKVSKKAVKRNKIKRWLREAVRKKLPRAKNGFDVVLVALEGLETKNFEEINKIIEELFKKTKLS